MPEFRGTHDVTNQPPPLADIDLFACDPALTEAVDREGASWAAHSLGVYGRVLGKAETIALADEANRNKPVLHTSDRFGHREDRVSFHPAWHALMHLGVSQGLHSAPWAEPKPGAHVARAAAFFLHGQVENGTQCPLSMTYGAVPALHHAPAIATEWLPRICTREYDPNFVPVAQKRGVLLGMGMTEKQGGSDVRANTTRAEKRADGSYGLTGHKWFFSAPMCDAFLILAQALEGLTCFFLPRFLPDGTVNAIRLQRLKDKLGNHSNASSEAEFRDAAAWPVGEPGRGVPTIIEMATHTRLDCALGAAAQMRAALTQAIHHARHRMAFGKRLIEHALMQAVLTDLAIESEAASVLVLRLARAFDHPHETALRRVLTPAAKFWLCKRAPAFVAEAMEVLGGNGYVEEAPLARLYREAPLNGIWEGAGNIMALDVQRALSRSEDALDALLTELEPARGGDSRLDALIGSFATDVRAASEPHAARHLAARITLAMQAALLIRHAPRAVADAFCASRLPTPPGAFGMLPSGLATRFILERGLAV